MMVVTPAGGVPSVVPIMRGCLVGGLRGDGIGTIL